MFHKFIILGGGYSRAKATIICALTMKLDTLLNRQQQVGCKFFTLAYLRMLAKPYSLGQQQTTVHYCI
jgi:hypothetical protein